MAFKKPTSNIIAPESPDRLFNDLPRRKHASLFDHQGQVLRSYFKDHLKTPDLALQLPTGSGKTLIGLLIAEWRRRKFHEKVVYLCPTRQLVNQVTEESSSKYGLTVQPFTGSASKYKPKDKTAYQDSTHIAVTTYSSLFNSNPFFSNPDIIIIDDTHAAENYIASQWTFRVSRLEPEDEILFKTILGIIKSILPDPTYLRLAGDWNGINDISWVDKVPSHKLASKSKELQEAINANICKNHKQIHSWTMLAENIKACQLYVSSSEIVLRPLIPPTWSHKPFTDAKQRIFMSATLGAGGDLERLTGRPTIERLPIPEGWDQQGIGRRYFLFPEKSLTEEETLALRRELMKKAGRSLVLTANNNDTELVIKDIEEHLHFPVFDASRIENEKSVFTNTQQAVAVIANRYDGIDFPSDDCRLLFVQNLSKSTSLQEKFLINHMGATLLFNERIKNRIFQAIGRCTRGMNDYSAIVITGGELSSYLTDKNRMNFFHPELQAELKFGIEQSTNVSPEDLLDNFDIFIRHDASWDEANQYILNERNESKKSSFPAMDEMENAVKHEILWQKSLWRGDYREAYNAALEVLKSLKSPDLRGYRALWHYLAGSAADLAFQTNNSGEDRNNAYNHYIKAKNTVKELPWIVRLENRFDASPRSNSTDNDVALLEQIVRLEEQFSSLGTANDRKFNEQERKIRELLKEGKTFEQGHVLLGTHLGFESGKEESNASPDPWWIAENIVLIFEDHANAKPSDSIIDATKARQAATHPSWVKHHLNVSSQAQIQSVLLTPARKAYSGAEPHLKNVAYWNLDEFRQWAEKALSTVRELRLTFHEQGNLDWRAEAVAALRRAGADAPGLLGKLKSQPADKHLEIVG